MTGHEHGLVVAEHRQIAVPVVARRHRATLQFIEEPVAQSRSRPVGERVTASESRIDLEDADRSAIIHEALDIKRAIGAWQGFGYGRRQRHQPWFFDGDPLGNLPASDLHPPVRDCTDACAGTVYVNVDGELAATRNLLDYVMRGLGQERAELQPRTKRPEPRRCTPAYGFRNEGEGPSVRLGQGGLHIGLANGWESILLQPEMGRRLIGAYADDFRLGNTNDDAIAREFLASRGVHRELGVDGRNDQRNPAITAKFKNRWDKGGVYAWRNHGRGVGKECCRGGETGIYGDDRPREAATGKRLPKAFQEPHASSRRRDKDVEVLHWSFLHGRSAAEFVHGDVAGMVDAAHCKHAGNRKRQDFDVQPYTAMIHIPDIEAEPLFPAQPVAPVHLSQAGQAGHYFMPAPLLWCVERQILEQQRPGPYQAHVAPQHVPELGKFIEAGASQELPDASQSIVIRQRRAITINRIRHRTKLIEREGAFLIARPSLPKQNRTTQGQANGDGYSQEERPQQNRSRNCRDDVQHSLHDVPFGE